MKQRIIGLAAVLMAVACGDTSEKAPTVASATATPSGSAATQPAAAPAPKPIERDAETERLVKAAAGNCKVNDVTEEVSDCKSGEYDAIGKYAQDKKPKNFHVTLAEMALTEGAKDPKIYRVAMNCLGNFAESGGLEWLKTNATPEAAERTLKLIASAPKEFDSYFSQAPKLTLAAGKIDETTAALKAAASPRMRSSGFYYYLDFAGIAALPALQAIVKDTSYKPSERAAAVGSVGAAVSPGIFGTDVVLAAADKAKACDWAKELANDATLEVANAAADSLGDCRDAYIDAALAALEKRVGAEPPSNGLISSVFHQCWAHGVVGRPPNGSAEQCGKALDLIDKITQSATISPGDLSWAVGVVGYIGEDAKDSRPKAREILGRFTHHKEKMVADNAKKSMDKLK
jgi:hypothetical protein